MNTENAQSNVKTFAGKAADKAEELRRQAADSINSAADSVRAAGQDAGQKLDSALSSVDNSETIGGFRETIRQNPVRSIAVATALGLVAGLTFRVSSR